MGFCAYTGDHSSSTVMVKVIISLELSSTESKSQSPWLCTFSQVSSCSC